MNSVVLFFVFLLLFIAYITFRSIPSTTNAPPEPPFDPSKQKNKLDCNLLNPKTIQTCDPATNKCSSCICSGDSSLSGCMSCTVVDEKNPYYFDFDQDSCTGDSLTWESGRCKLKNGSYCLPTKMNEIDCNPYTGRKILSLNANGKYEWKCVCVDETRFGGDHCDIIKLCGLNGTTNPKSGTNFGLKNTKNGEYWSGTSLWSPFPDTDSGNTCVCDTSKTSNDKTLTCVNNSCAPGKVNPKDSSKCDDCGQDYVDCVDISGKVDDNGVPYFSGICKIGSCVPDPCHVDGISGNKYDKNTNMCACDESQGYIVAQDSTNSFGQTCKKACQNNGPCGQGDDKRGDCYVYPTVKDNNNLWDIVCINEGSEQQTCKTSSKIVIRNVGSGLYLGVNTDTNTLVLSTDRNIPSNLQNYEFSFTRDCSDQTTKDGQKIEKCDKSVINLYPNENYFVTTGTGMYVDFNGKKIVVEKTNALLITLLKETSNEGKTDKSDGDTDRQFKIYLPSSTGYLGLDAKNTLSVKKLFGGTERCGVLGGDGQINQRICSATSIYSIFNQDKNLLCNGSGRCTCGAKDPFFYPNSDIRVEYNSCESGSVPTCIDLVGRHDGCYCNGSGI